MDTRVDEIENDIINEEDEMMHSDTPQQFLYNNPGKEQTIKQVSPSQVIDELLLENEMQPEGQQDQYQFMLSPEVGGPFDFIQNNGLLNHHESLDPETFAELSSRLK